MEIPRQDKPDKGMVCIELHDKRTWYEPEEAYTVLRLDCWALVVHPKCFYDENKRYGQGELHIIWRRQVKELSDFLQKKKQGLVKPI